MMDDDLIERLSRAIASHVTPKVPFDKTLWSADDCAEYLRMDKKTFQQYYACHPHFPKRIHLERSEGRGKTLWRAQEIVDWAVKNRRGK